MNVVVKTFSKLSLAMLVLLSAAFFVVPARNELQAQSSPQGKVSFCLNRNASGQYKRAYYTPGSTTNPQCPSGWDQLVALNSDKGFCVGEKPPIQTKSPNDPGVKIVDNNGTTCEHKVTEANGDEKIMIYKFVTFANLEQYTPTGTTPPIITSPTGTTPGTTKPPTGGTTTPTPPTGGCETGFHKVGPLCVPNSPFRNGNSITSETTVGGLATRIIKILLYFAGIVAVIMSIIGGYQVMTAAGNATQAANGRKTLTNAVIGLVIVILSYIIIQAVISFVS